jgi:hypothetical protein
MSSHPNPPSERKPIPAYVRVFRSYLRNVSSPAVWAPMAMIALLLALSADYWNSLRVLDEDLEASLISENTSQLADSFSEASSIAASEIDSSDVLSNLLSQAELPVMADDNSVEKAKEQTQRFNLEDVDLLDLPNLSQSSGEAGNNNASDGNTASTSTPSRRFGLLDLLSDNYTADSSTSSTSPASSSGGMTRGVTSLLGGRTIAEDDPDNADVTGNTNPSPAATGFNRSSQTSTLLNTNEAEPTASLAQFSSGGTFTGYPAANVTVPSVTGFSNTPAFTGYPTGGANVPTTTSTGGFTGYPTSPYVAPNFGASYAPSQYDSSYGNVQYGTQPNLNTTTGVNSAPVTSGSPQNGYATGVTNGAEVTAPAAAYSIPRSAPGRYIGNGEINTFANP